MYRKCLNILAYLLRGSGGICDGLSKLSVDEQLSSEDVMDIERWALCRWVFFSRSTSKELGRVATIVASFEGEPVQVGLATARDMFENSS